MQALADMFGFNFYSLNCSINSILGKKVSIAVSIMHTHTHTHTHTHLMIIGT